MGIVLLAAGCASGQPPASPDASPPPSRPAPSASVTLDRRAAAARYLTIATVGNRRLETDFDRLNSPDRRRLAAAQADLRDAAATEHLFDQQLLAIGFPRPIETVSKRLAAVNEARADLTSRAAVATSLQLLRRYEKQLTASDAAVEAAVKTIRSQLGLPPPATS